MERNSYSTSNPVDQFDDDYSSSYTSMIYLYSLGILPYSFEYATQKFLSGSTSILQNLFPQFSSTNSFDEEVTSANDRRTSSHDELAAPSQITSTAIADESSDDDAMDMDDVAIVMTRLGLPPSSSDDDSLFTTNPIKLGRTEVSTIFDEREPSLDEVKAAFDVFDANRDGFIDAMELGRVLCVLGLTTEGSDVQSCAQMINSVDEDGDGKLGFNEFLKFMQKSFC